MEFSKRVFTKERTETPVIFFLDDINHSTLEKKDILAHLLSRIGTLNVP